MSKIILICELPGSGKTTLANKIFQNLKILRFTMVTLLEKNGS